MTARNSKQVMKRTILIVFVSLIVQLVYGWLLHSTGQEYFAFSGDAPSYLQTAHNVIDSGIWSMDPLQNPAPDNFRTPIYPLILVAFFTLGIPLWILFVAQALVIAGTAGLLYRYGRALFSERAGFLAGLLLAIDPFLASRFVAKALMTESFSLPLILVGFGSLALFVKRSNGKDFLISITALGIGANLKPQFIFFLALAYLAIFLATRISVRTIITAFAITGALILPWLGYSVFGLHVIQYSSVSETTLFDVGYRFQHWYTKGANPYFNDDYRIAGKALTGAKNSEQLFEPHTAKRLATTGRGWIMQAPLAFLWFHTTRIPRTFYHDTTVDTLHEDFGWFPTLEGSNSTDFVKDILLFRWPRALDQAREHPAVLLALFIQILVVLVSCLALLNFVIRRVKTGKYSRVSLLWFILLFTYGLLVSPVGLHRYRVPIEPMLLLLAMDSILLLSERKKRITITI
jgi:hypothetical protein